MGSGDFGSEVSESFVGGKQCHGSVQFSISDAADWHGVLIRYTWECEVQSTF